MAFSITKFLKGLLISEAGTNTPKEILIIPGGTVGTKTTVTSSQTIDRIITLPDSTDMLIGRTSIDTLTNKILTNAILNDSQINLLLAAEQGVTPSTPAAGYRKFYAKSGGLYDLNSAGIETLLGSGGSGGGGANTTLSNLIEPTAINATLLPSSNGVTNIGSLTKLFNAIYANNLIANNFVASNGYISAGSNILANAYISAGTYLSAANYLNVGLGTPATDAPLADKVIEVLGTQGTLIIGTNATNGFATQRFMGLTPGKVFDINYHDSDGSLVLTALNKTAGILKILGSALQLTSMSLDMTGSLINNVADPVNPQDAATKAFVLANAGGGALNLVQSPNSGFFTTASSGSIDVTNLSVSITTTGGRVRLSLEAFGTSAISVDAVTTSPTIARAIGEMSFLRNALIVNSAQFGTSVTSTTSTNSQLSHVVSANSFGFTDITLAAGTYTYSVQVRNVPTTGTSSTVSIFNIKLTAEELK